MRILYIDIDSLRPDHLSCYGYHRQTSPYIDQIAAEGVRFTNFYCSDSPCLPSRTALFTGMFGVRTGVVNHGGAYADMPLEGTDRGFRARVAMDSFGAVLRRAGHHTCMISPFPNRHTAYQVTFGFGETYDTGKGGLENADEMYPPASAWLRANGHKDNWFLHVNFWDPHTPYDHPADFGNPFMDDPIEPWITQELLDKQNASYGPHGAHDVPGYDDKLPPIWTMGVGRIRNLADAKAHMDGYDTGIRYADHFIGRLIDDLQALGIYDETAIIVSADHGENQGELNIWGDHQTADHITNRVPLIVRWPGVTDGQAGSVRAALHYHLDLPATVMELLGAAQPAAWDGASFAADLSTTTDRGRDYLALSQGAWSCQRAVRWDNWLLIRTYHTGLKAFPAYMLFDLDADPHETTNLAASRPDLLGEGLRRLDEWMGEQMYRSQRGDPFWGVIAEGGPLHAKVGSRDWNGYLARLHASGRGHHADALAQHAGRPITRT